MATANEITNAAGYVGNAALGGYIPSAIDIDTKPLQSLAAYTAMQNRQFYEQRVKDADNKIAELAAISAYDITNARGKDKEDVMREYDILLQAGREYAQMGVPKTPQEKVRQELAFQEKVQKADKIIKAANRRNIAYQVRLNAINQENTSANIKEVKKKQLDEEFDNTSLDTPLNAEEKFNFVLPTLPQPVYTKNTTSIDTGNEIVQQEVSIFNPAKSKDAVLAKISGLMPQSLPENSSPQQRRQFELIQASGGEMKVLNEATVFLNEALQNPEYKNEDGAINTEAVYSDNKIAGSILKGIDRYNKYATDLKQDIANGYYTTKTGGKVNLLNIIRDSDVFLIDKNKPLSTENVAFIQSFLTAAPDTKDEKIIVTGESDRRLNILLDAENQRKNREEQARQFNVTRSGSGSVGGSENTQTTGNAFDEIGGTEEITLKSGGKVSNGIVVDKNNKVYTGKIALPAGNIPSNMVAALQAANIEMPTGDGFINVTVKDGVITSVLDINNKPISRQGMENAQKKFDTEQKGQSRTQWGRLLEANVLPANQGAPPTTGVMSDAEYSAYLKSKGLR